MLICSNKFPICFPPEPIGVYEFAKYLKLYYKQSKLSGNCANLWPPDQPSHFISRVLVHKKDKLTAGVECIIPTQCESTYSDVVLNYHNTKKSKNITELLDLFDTNQHPRMILIEGIPGTGKSMLSTEITLQWASGNFLVFHEKLLVFLLSLHDPFIQKLDSLSGLVKFYHFNDAYCTYITDYITKSHGEQVVFIIDGYDKAHIKLQKHSLVALIVQRKILPDASLIITACPPALTPFLNKVDLHLELVGFTDEDRERYIEESLKQQECTKEVMEYLKVHPTVSWVCYVPFNLTILLFLYNQGLALPDHPAQLFEQFICYSIHHFVSQSTSYKYSSIQNLLKPHSEIIKQLSISALHALCHQQTTRTEMNPTLRAIPELTMGLGFVQTIKHPSGVKCLQFVHSEVQEFLGAYGITFISKEESAMLWRNADGAFFQSLNHTNILNFYTWLCEPDDRKLYLPLYEDQSLNYLRHFRYSFEEINFTTWKCDTICAGFKKVINLTYCRLGPMDLETLGLLINYSHQWKALFLSDCYIRDIGIAILHHSLKPHPEHIINTLWLQNNMLTSSSCYFISELIMNFKVTNLDVSQNLLDEMHGLENILIHTPSVLEKLDLSENQFNSNAAMTLFTAVQKGKCKKLKVIDLHSNLIGDEAVPVIAATLRNDKILEELLLNDNLISEETLLQVLYALKENSTLSVLVLSNTYSQELKSKVKTLSQEINVIRRSKSTVYTSFKAIFGK